MAKIYTTIGPVRKNIFAHKYLVRNYVSQGWFLGQECRDIVLLCFDVQMWLKSVRSHACLKTASRYDVVCAAAAVVAPRQKYGKVGSSSSHITWVGRRLDQSEPDITGACSQSESGMDRDQPDSCSHSHRYRDGPVSPRLSTLPPCRAPAGSLYFSLSATLLQQTAL